MIIIRSYDSAIVRHSPFSCGEPVLDDWLKQFAGQNERRDKDYQARGVGSLVLTDILKRLERASHDMGFELVVVDALHEDAACFYLKRGFRRMIDHPLKLFITTRDLRASLADTI